MLPKSGNSHFIINTEYYLIKYCNKFLFENYFSQIINEKFWKNDNKHGVTGFHCIFCTEIPEIYGY